MAIIISVYNLLLCLFIPAMAKLVSELGQLVGTSSRRSVTGTKTVRANRTRPEMNLTPFLPGQPSSHDIKCPSFPVFFDHPDQKSGAPGHGRRDSSEPAEHFRQSPGRVPLKVTVTPVPKRLAGTIEFTLSLCCGTFGTV